MKTYNDEGTKELLLQRLQCIREWKEKLDTQLDSIIQQRNDCCATYEDGITMGGTFVTMGGETVIMAD